MIVPFDIIEVNAEPLKRFEHYFLLIQKLKKQTPTRSRSLLKCVYFLLMYLRTSMDTAKIMIKPLMMYWMYGLTPT